MADKYGVHLFSTVRVYHIVDKYKSLVCKVTVHSQKLHGIFIDGELPDGLEKAIHVWAVKSLIACSERIVVLGRINALDTWQP